jgi:holo-[acyl-carrier protein] synthase
MRVGIDLVSVTAVRDSIRQFGDRYLERVYTRSELADCTGKQGIVVERLAGRFAVKEATLKVLRPENVAIAWTELHVRRHDPGWVEVVLVDRAAALAREAGLSDFAVSIAHEGAYATAVVVAELTTETRTHSR